MMTDEIRTFVQRHVENMSTHDAVLTACDHAEDGILESPSTGTHRGRGEITQNYERWNTAFPDFEVALDNIVGGRPGRRVLPPRCDTPGRFSRAPSNRQADRVSGSDALTVRE